MKIEEYGNAACQNIGLLSEYSQISSAGVHDSSGHTVIRIPASDM